MPLWGLGKQSVWGYYFCVWCWRQKSTFKSVEKGRWMWRGGSKDKMDGLELVRTARSYIHLSPPPSLQLWWWNYLQEKLAFYLHRAKHLPQELNLLQVQAFRMLTIQICTSATTCLSYNCASQPALTLLAQNTWQLLHFFLLQPTQTVSWGPHSPRTLQQKEFWETKL